MPPPSDAPGAARDVAVLGLVGDDRTGDRLALDQLGERGLGRGAAMPGSALPVETGLAGLEGVDPVEAHVLTLDDQRVAVDHLIGPGRPTAEDQRCEQHYQ